MALSALLLLLGIVILIIAGDWMVRGAAALARHWGIPSLIVGLTIVAFGTSAPELFVSIQAVLNGTSELAAGNVIGSNVANVLLALGAPALIMAIPTNMAGVGRNAAIALFATLLFIGLILISMVTTDLDGSVLSLWQGAILFACILIYLIWMFRLAKSGADDPILAEMTEIDEGEDGLPDKIWQSAAFMVAGFVGLALGGNLIVEHASIIAEHFGVSQTIIGLTIVAIGTSLPEVATVVIAAYRGHAEVAIGNVLGSNIFNIFAVAGAAALTGPIVIEKQLLIFDVWVMLAAMVALFVIILSRMPIGKKTGVMFLAGYVLYMAALVRSAVI